MKLFIIVCTYLPKHMLKLDKLKGNEMDLYVLNIKITELIQATSS